MSHRSDKVHRAPARRKPLRRFSARTRVNTSALVGLAVGVLVGLAAPWQLALLVGWDVTALVLLTWIWLEVFPCDAKQTRLRATAEDSSRTTAVVVMVTASTVSLVAVALGLAKAKNVGTAMEWTLTVSAVLTVVLSWCLVHTMFALHYAHVYYTPPVGGIEFLGGGEPDYQDFGYLSFTIGMAFALSDTPVPNRLIRRSVTHHAFVSYLFSAVIIGLAINVTAGIIR